MPRDSTVTLVPRSCKHLVADIRRSEGAKDQYEFVLAPKAHSEDIKEILGHENLRLPVSEYPVLSALSQDEFLAISTAKISVIASAADEKQAQRLDAAFCSALHYNAKLCDIRIMRPATGGAAAADAVPSEFQLSENLQRALERNRILQRSILSSINLAQPYQQIMVAKAGTKIGLQRQLEQVLGAANHEANQLHKYLDSDPDISPALRRQCKQYLTVLGLRVEGLSWFFRQPQLMLGFMLHYFDAKNLTQVLFYGLEAQLQTALIFFDKNEDESVYALDAVYNSVIAGRNKIPVKQRQYILTRQRYLLQLAVLHYIKETIKDTSILAKLNTLPEVMTAAKSEQIETIAVLFTEILEMLETSQTDSASAVSADADSSIPDKRLVELMKGLQEVNIKTQFPSTLPAYWGLFSSVDELNVALLAHDDLPVQQEIKLPPTVTPPIVQIVIDAVAENKPLTKLTLSVDTAPKLEEVLKALDSNTTLEQLVLVNVPGELRAGITSNVVRERCFCDVSFYDTRTRKTFKFGDDTQVKYRKLYEARHRIRAALIEAATNDERFNAIEMMDEAVAAVGRLSEVMNRKLKQQFLMPVLDCMQQYLHTLDEPLDYALLCRNLLGYNQPEPDFRAKNKLYLKSTRVRAEIAESLYLSLRADEGIDSATLFVLTRCYNAPNYFAPVQQEFWINALTRACNILPGVDIKAGEHPYFLKLAFLRHIANTLPVTTDEEQTALTQLRDLVAPFVAEKDWSDVAANQKQVNEAYVALSSLGSPVLDLTAVDKTLLSPTMRAIWEHQLFPKIADDSTANSRQEFIIELHRQLRVTGAGSVTERINGVDHLLTQDGFKQLTDNDLDLFKRHLIPKIEKDIQAEIKAHHDKGSIVAVLAYLVEKRMSSSIMRDLYTKTLMETLTGLGASPAIVFLAMILFHNPVERTQQDAFKKETLALRDACSTLLQRASTYESASADADMSPEGAIKVTLLRGMYELLESASVSKPAASASAAAASAPTTTAAASAMFQKGKSSNPAVNALMQQLALFSQPREPAIVDAIVAGFPLMDTAKFSEKQVGDLSPIILRWLQVAQSSTSTFIDEMLPAPAEVAAAELRV